MVMRSRLTLGVALSVALSLSAHPTAARSTPSVQDGQIAFVTWYDDPSLVAISPDGTGRTVLTTGSYGYASPTWSPDGRKLLFVGVDQITGHQIFMINADGTGLRQLTSGPSDNDYPAWSPDGRQIAFTRDRGNGVRLLVMDLADHTVTQVTRRGYDAIEPSWSPDGSQIVFRAIVDQTYEAFIATVSADGSSGPIAIVRDPYYEHWQPDWSPDGQKIAFTECHVDCWIEVANSDGTGLQALTGPGNYDPAWSPDGSQIAFITGLNDPLGYFDIDVMNADGSDPHPVTLTPGENEGDPAWQPLP
jgi:TolB protein